MSMCPILSFKSGVRGKWLLASQFRAVRENGSGSFLMFIYSFHVQAINQPSEYNRYSLLPSYYKLHLIDYMSLPQFALNFIYIEMNGLEQGTVT